MATSKTVLAAKLPIVGIKQEASFGVALDTSDPDTTAYRQLPLVQAVKPTFTPGAHEARFLSGRGSMKNLSDVYHSMAGGEATMPFEFPATPKLWAQFMALVGQEHSDSGTYLHETEFDGTSNAVVAGGTVTGSIPASVNLAYSTGTNGEGLVLCGAVVKDLTMSFSAGSNNNLLMLSGNFYSGHTVFGASTSHNEVSYSGGTWVAPETTYFPIASLLTKSLEVDGSTVDVVIKNFTMTISNGAVKGSGLDSSGNPEQMTFPEYTVTGSMTVKYDENADYGASHNIFEDFRTGQQITAQLIWGDGSNDANGDAQIDMLLTYSGDHGQEEGEGHMWHTLNFECGYISGTEGLKVQVFSDEDNTSW